MLILRTMILINVFSLINSLVYIAVANLFLAATFICGTFKNIIIKKITGLIKIHINLTEVAFVMHFFRRYNFPNHIDFSMFRYASK